MKGEKKIKNGQGANNTSDAERASCPVSPEVPKPPFAPKILLLIFLGLFFKPKL